MGRLCGGVHEISGISAPLWLHAWVLAGFMGWVGLGVGGGGLGGGQGGVVGMDRCVHGMVVWWRVDGWCGGGGVGVGGCVVVGWVGVGEGGGGVVGWW